MTRRLAVLAFLLLLSPSSRAQDDYEIGAEDVLHVVVVGQTDMTADFNVDREGMLSFPALGKIKAGGLTLSEFERKLTTLLADGYLKRPQVSVAAKEFKSQKVFVTGQVPRPGAYFLKADRSLLALLGDLGSLGSDAGHEIVVIRPPQAAAPEQVQPTEIPADTDATEVAEQVPGAQTYRVSLRDLQAGKPEANIRLQAGDTVYFPKAQQVYISGQVGRPGPYKFQEGTTVLQALTLAGGITPRGAGGRMKIIRTVDGVKKELKAKLTDLVQPEDTIVVPERFF